jgi:hypothetical protein
MSYKFDKVILTNEQTVVAFAMSMMTFSIINIYAESDITLLFAGGNWSHRCRLTWAAELVEAVPQPKKKGADRYSVESGLRVGAPTP